MSKGLRENDLGPSPARDVLVPEGGPSGDPPPEARAAAQFWAENGAARWEKAVATERQAGIAVCDTDPLKLHYAWSLWQIGAGSESEFRQQAVAYREMVVDRRIGFADAYIVSIPAARAAAEVHRLAAPHGGGFMRVAGANYALWGLARRKAHPASWRQHQCQV
ncbi:MAG: hypothetical protein ACRDGB_15450 [Candidatus Limnocylindria bacterium]